MNQNEYQQIEIETEHAVARGFDGARIEWRANALKELVLICREKETFTVNDFRERITEETHDRRAMGGIMRTGAKHGWIEKTGSSITSRVGHLSPLQVWRSKLYRRAL